MPDCRSRFNGRPKTVFPDGWDDPRTLLTCDAVRITAQTMLAALPSRSRRLLTTPDTLIVVQVPSAAWVSPVWRHLHATLLGENADKEAGWSDPSAAAVLMHRVEAWQPWAELEDALDLAEEAGQTVIGISHDPIRCLPPQLVAAAHHVLVPPLTEVEVRRVIRAVTGQTIRGRVSSYQATSGTHPGAPARTHPSLLL